MVFFTGYADSGSMLNGQTCLVTGSSRGIGRGIAYDFADEGAQVVINYRSSAEQAEAVVDDIEAAGGEAIAVQADVADYDGVEMMREEVHDEFGSIDVLVNNAGITWGAPALEMPMEKWRDVLEVNLTGTFIVTRIVGERMLERGSGSIINISSVGGMRGLAASVQEAIGYNTSKGGLISFTRDLATKWAADGVRVNALVPGMFPTRMTEWMEGEAEEAFLEETPMGRPAELDEIKGPAVFLASDAASYVTGQVLPVDGGTTL